MDDLGVFSHLENLEKAKIKARENDSFNAQENHRLQCLRSRKVKLEQKKKELEDQVKQRHMCMERVLSNADATRELPDDAKDVLLKLEENRLSNILQAYRLTGTTLESVDGKTARLRLETSHLGRYSPPFYVELLMEEQTFSLKRHSLPKFIPELEARRCLQCGLREFCVFVHSYLKPFIARREEAFTTQEKFQTVIKGDICSSPSFDYIELRLKAGYHGIHCIKLLYEDILSSRPSQVRLEDSEGLETAGNEGLEKDLKLHLLSHVFTEHFTDEYS